MTMTPYALMAYTLVISIALAVVILLISGLISVIKED